MKRTIFSLSFIALATFVAVPVFAQDYGLGATAGAAGLKSGSVPVLIGNAIGAGLSMVSVVFFALMIYGGIRYMTARGDEDHTKKAINTIWAAVIGLLIVLASYAVTNFVFNALANQTATTPTAQVGTCVALCPTVSVSECNNLPFCATVNGACVETAPGASGCNAFTSASSCGDAANCFWQ